MKKEEKELDKEITQETDVKANKRKKKDKRFKNNKVVRIEELEKLLSQSDSGINPEDIVSMYMPRRKMKNFATALLRLDKLYLCLMGLILFIAILFIASFMQEKMGNFTINLNRLELYRKGVSIAPEGQFTNATARLTANTVEDATNISINDLPDNLNELDGEHNGRNYMAYTYYIRNAGKEDLGYIASITLDSCAKGAENAVRVAVWRNDERTVYAMPAADGGTEEGCVNFESDKVVCRFQNNEFNVGYVEKYTIVIWMEGDDPECVDSIVGGSVEFSMNIDADYEDDTNLLSKYLKDIKDSLFNDKPIDAAGNNAPNYGGITWENRLNK